MWGSVVAVGLPAHEEGTFVPVGDRPCSRRFVVMREFEVDSHGASLLVRDNESDGEPLLLLHGGPGVPDSMQSTIAPLLPELRAISFDQRGVGHSTCRNGDYGLAAYISDIEAIRDRLSVESWHVLGHSWGGLLAQAYTAGHPQRVRSLFLSSSSLGVAGDWKETKRVAFRTNRERGGFAGTLRFLGYGSVVYLPGPLRGWAMRHVMTETWHNYFMRPRSAPDPDHDWLAGCSAKAMLGTDRAVAKESTRVLDCLSSYRGRALVLYGEYDIFGTSTTIVRRRFPHADQVILSGSGHLHWIQNPSAYQEVLRRFYAARPSELQEPTGMSRDPAT